MVTNSRTDYNQYKKDVYKIYLKKFPKKIDGIKKFMMMLSSRYDEKQRVYFSHKFMFYLFGKHNYVMKKNQHYWIAFIGRKGGEGKSTLCSNVMYFLDNTFDKSRIGLTYDDFIKIIPEAKSVTPYPSIQLDEPENKTHVLSWKGRKMKDILERVRQLNLNVGICANTLSSVPSFIYERLDCIVYLENFRFWAWDNQMDKPKHTIIDDIKKEFTRKGKGHATFKLKDIQSRAFIKHQGFSPDFPFDNKTYLKEKEEDLLCEISEYNAKKEANNIKKEVTNEEMVRLIKEKNPDCTTKVISQALNINDRWARRLKARLSANISPM